MSFYFLTFGSGKSFEKSLERIKEQAINMHIFKEVFAFNENDLKQIPEFWDKNKAFIESNPRGYGYWLWKPFLIKYILKRLNPEDILLYSDCGSTLKQTGIGKLLIYFINAANTKNGILGFELSYPEKEYTKMDIFRKLNAIYLINTPQISATNIIICKKPDTEKIIQKWYDICISDNYHYIDDTQSLLPNADNFVENRHDQSIYSIVLKLYGGYHLLGEETEINEDEYPIWDSRIRE